MMWLFAKRNHIRNVTESVLTGSRKMKNLPIDFVLVVTMLNMMQITVVQTSNSFDTQGPSFSVEPANRLEFTNSIGCRADCIVRGNPQPNIEWLDQHNNPVSTIPKVRHILGNGSLYFPPFEAELFRQEVHLSIYRCLATNTVGTIVSRDVNVKAVVNQRYEPEVQNPGGFLGSNVMIKCNIPQFVEDYVTITSWLQEPSFNIFPSLDGDGKYHMLPTGELLIINITKLDAQRTYRCRSHHQLTQETRVSSNVGRIQLTEMQELVPPIMNTKFVKITARVDDPLVVPCVAYANPSPIYRWFQHEDKVASPLKSGRAVTRYGSLIISSVKPGDSGTYFCTATNSEGSETLEVKISVLSLLSAHIQPSRQTIDLGKSADLTCIISGFPQNKVWWLKDGNPLRTGSRVRLLDKATVKITSITKEDKGMYQCFVKNDHESTQGTAELRLGEVSPQLVYKFIEQTMQPGPSVSLKCSATGNPTPQITWNLDGFPLPNNDRLMIGQYVTMFGDVISHVNISAVKSEDGGEYECVAKSRAGSTVHSARLNIYGMPYVRPMSPISAVAGKSLTIKCPVAGFPIESIIWEKVPPKITPFSFARDLNVGDRTSIQCVVVTGDLPLTFTWLKDNQLIITGSSMASGHHTVDSNDNMIKRISDHRSSDSKGSVNNVVEMTNEEVSGSGIPSDGRIVIRQNDDFTSALSITSVTRAQGGIYTCRVQNDAATVTHSAQLRVNVPPRVAAFSFEDDITEGMRTQLMCSSSQGDQPFNITWMRDGRLIQAGQNGDGSGHKDINMVTVATGGPHSNDQTITINDYPPYSSILSIHNVTSKHNGNYTCLITNRAGTVDYTAFLSVAVPPRWILEPQDQSAILGNSVMIICKADGFPLPKVQWKQAIGEQTNEYRELNYPSDNSGIESYGNGSLIIQQVAREHEGYFLCQASNGIGAGLSKLIKLTVHVGPHVTVFNHNESVRRGNRATLKCIVHGDQPLDVSWRAKGNRIDPTYDIRYQMRNSPIDRGIESELTLVQTSLSDRGEYSCVASNAYGHDHAAIHLQIDEPPNFPKNFHCVELGRRSITVGWSPNDPEIGLNSHHISRSQKISSYILQYKEAQEDGWHEHNKLILPGNRTTAQVNNLRPATSYHFRVFAENNLGRSAASEILHITTDTEVPGGKPQLVIVKPTAPQELLITWRPPERDLWHGELLGYTIGFQKHDSPDPSFNYTRIGIPGGEGMNDFRLTGLEKYTQYAVTVAAYNIKGDGPPSDPVLAHTLEDTPSAPPERVTCRSQSAQSINISWHEPPISNHHGIIQGYKVFFEPTNLDVDYGKRETKVTTMLNTVLFNLEPFTNYSIQVLAFTHAGDGVPSPMINCMTEETTPGSPERVKAIPTSESSAIISWLPPRRPNGIIIKYTIVIRTLGKEGNNKVQHDIPAHNTYFEVRDLSLHEVYEAWMVASTQTGPGPKTAAVKMTASRTVPAAIISFGQTLSVSWRVDVNLPCLYVGHPKPSADWKILNQRSSKSKHRLETNDENVLILRNVQRFHEGNYSCTVRNPLGTDHITYQLFVQVPPSAPKLSVIAATINSISLQWHVGDTGGAPLRGFILQYRHEFGDWQEMHIDRRFDSYLFENFQCGTRYQFMIAALNKIGIGPFSSIETSKTKGDKPVSPRKHHLIRSNITSVLLELASWQDGGCPILFFSIEFKRAFMNSDWIVVSSNVAAQARYTIGDLEPATSYNLRITAHNNAGTTIAEYYFETLTLTGLLLNAVDTSDNLLGQSKTFFADPHTYAILIVILSVILFATIGMCFCMRNYPRLIFGRNSHSGNSGLDSKNPPISDSHHSQQQNQSHREQFYATVHKLSAQQSPRDSETGLERIPEYSEDIYPYATFHLPDHENQSGNSGSRGPRKGMSYDSRDSTLSVGSQAATLKILRPQSVNSGSNSGNMGLVAPNIGTEKRNRHKSKTIKSESEEYDSLNSDSDSSERGGVGGVVGSASRTESSVHLDEPELLNFTSNAHTPDSKTSKERLSVFTRPPLYKNKNIGRESSISPEQTQTSEPIVKSPSRPNHQQQLLSRNYFASGSGISGHKRTIRGGNFSLDMPFDVRDVNPSRKQQHHHQQQQQQSAQTSPASSAATQSQCNNSPVSFNYNNNSTERSAAAKLSSAISTTASPAQAQSSQILRKTYQNLSRLPIPRKLNSSNSAMPAKQYETQLNGAPLKIYEMQQTSLILNKSYGDFLTITPRRRGRSAIPSPAKPNGTNNSPSLQEGVRNDITLKTAEYELLGRPESKQSTETDYSYGYECGQRRLYDHRAMENFCNGNTLKLESDMSHRVKFSSYSSIYSVKDASESSDDKRQPPYHDILEYANIISLTSPPSAFSDNLDTDLKSVSSHPPAVTTSKSRKYCVSPREYTIAV